mmetsp:Transcript_45693/g.99179  ORF Transcript_45693/g.99179 Transcript_45693/m.99179 type:complete len:289 (+) Transcript_45693:94-960(+)|eukprot:CAMPEP_0204257544 /NCGR_PEP_ID=MMETSP0468-20130131/4492_1 /ASSEMBLY_ACC=CAM_ASM_000383 /TAXON_ID=2969 /ORGANISM="Oxyrrhis marina" /LENGTH=288 /DNA_ID=CAMNT_0051231675 /DNA_START=90 /DNA_END=956 /DNA_ORIENTATION=-
MSEAPTESDDHPVHSPEAAHTIITRVFQEADQIETEALTMKDKVMNGVPQRLLVAHLQAEIKEDRSCSSLPGSCMFVFLFCVSCLLAEQTTMTFAIRSLLNEVTSEDANFAFINGTEEQKLLDVDADVGMKVLGNVNTRQDIHSWLRLGFLSLFNDAFESGNPVQWGFNVAVGGIRVSQQVADGEQCYDGEFAVRFTGTGLCYPAQYPGGGYLQPPLPKVLATSGGDADNTMWVLFEDGWEAGVNQVDEVLRPNGTWLRSGQPEFLCCHVQPGNGDGGFKTEICGPLS